MNQIVTETQTKIPFKLFQNDNKQKWRCSPRSVIANERQSSRIDSSSSISQDHGMTYSHRSIALSANIAPFSLVESSIPCAGHHCRPGLTRLDLCVRDRVGESTRR